MPRFGLDFGNSDIKAYDPRSKTHFYTRHAIAFLSSSEWGQMAARGKIQPGFVRVNGQPLAFGDAARRYLLTDPPKGASRYKAEYYGVGLAYMLSEIYRRNVASIALVATHAPTDLDYAGALEAAARGIWQVESRWGDLTFQVKTVNTVDEPIAGYANFTLNEDGKERRRNPLINAMTLVVDVGGHTTDIAKIDPNGAIDNLSLKSTRTGALNVLNKFEERLRSQYAELFQDTLNIDPRRIEAAMNNGFYAFGSSRLDCLELAAQCRAELVNDITQIIRGAGGVANFDYILLTGGGGQMIKNDLSKAYKGIEFLTAETDPDLMRFANSFGAVKLALLMESLGEW